MRPKLSGVSKEEVNGVVTKKGRARVGKIYFIFLIVDTTYHYYHCIHPRILYKDEHIVLTIFGVFDFPILIFGEVSVHQCGVLVTWECTQTGD